MGEELQGPAAASEAPEAESRVWTYLGVGCLTAVLGLVGGGMIAVLVAKIVGALVHCAPEKESGAPCAWDRYWTWGARIGVVLLPAVSLWRLRGRRPEAKNTERG